VKFLSERSDGVVLSLHVKAGGKRDRITPHDEWLRVEVRAPREKGKANAAVIALLAEQFGVPREDVVLLRGELDSRKVVLVRGSSVAGLVARAAGLARE
jgi:uncharacterized protein (TIGR00251 family)